MQLTCNIIVVLPVLAWFVVPNPHPSLTCSSLYSVSSCNESIYVRVHVHVYVCAVQSTVVHVSFCLIICCQCPSGFLVCPSWPVPP